MRLRQKHLSGAYIIDSDRGLSGWCRTHTVGQRCGCTGQPATLLVAVRSVGRPSGPACARSPVSNPDRIRKQNADPCYKLHTTRAICAFGPMIYHTSVARKIIEKSKMCPSRFSYRALARKKNTLPRKSGHTTHTQIAFTRCARAFNE